MSKKIERRETVQDEAVSGMRLDRYLSDVLQICSRSQLKARNVAVKLNGKASKLHKSLEVDDVLEIEYDAPRELHVEAEDIPLDIIFENDRVLILNKAQGMVVHPAAGNYTGTLVQALLHHVKELRDNFQGETVRPGIVHRLDKDTSGIIVVAKDEAAREILAKQFAKKKVKKIYYAVVKGHVQKPHGRVEHAIARDPHNRKRFTWKREDGKRALTNYRVIRYLENATLLRLAPETGRTHQLRVHMSSLGHPIVGDPIYGRTGGSFGKYNLLLHAHNLSIRLPDEEVARNFIAPLPEHFKRALAELRPKQ